VKENGFAIQCVPEKFMTEAVCFQAAVKNKYHDSEVLKFVPLKFMTPELCLEAVKSNGTAVQWVPENLRTAEICLEAVKKGGSNLYYVPDELMTPELCLEAVKKNGFALKCVPEKFMTEALCLEAVKHDGRALKCVPEKFMTEALCLEAVKQDGGALIYVPEEMQEELRHCCGAVDNRFRSRERAMIIITMENFFWPLKPASDTNVVTETGYVIESKEVLALIKELKRFIEKDDVKGFWDFLHNNPEVAARKKALTVSERQCLYHAVITDGGSTVFEILDDINDLMDDENISEIFSALDDMYINH
jgi:hypothetical protein